VTDPVCSGWTSQTAAATLANTSACEACIEPVEELGDGIPRVVREQQGASHEPEQQQSRGGMDGDIDHAIARGRQAMDLVVECERQHSHSSRRRYRNRAFQSSYRRIPFEQLLVVQVERRRQPIQEGESGQENDAEAR
jgi:hypothetical protein